MSSALKNFRFHMAAFQKGKHTREKKREKEKTDSPRKKKGEGPEKK